MNIDKLTNRLKEIKEQIEEYQRQIDTLNNNNRFFSYYKFVMSAKMVSYGNSEMPSQLFDLPHELEKDIAKMFKSWLEKKINELETERKKVIEKLAKEI